MKKMRQLITSIKQKYTGEIPELKEDFLRQRNKTRAGKAQERYEEI